MRRKKKKELIVNAFYVHNEVIEETTCIEDSFYEINEDPDFDYLLRFIMKSQKDLQSVILSNTKTTSFCTLISWLIKSSKFPKSLFLMLGIHAPERSFIILSCWLFSA